MMAFLDLGEAFEHMIPEWEALLAGSALSDRHTEVTLLINRTPFRIRTHKGAIDVAKAPGLNKISLRPETAMQLLTGYVYVEDVINAERRMLSGGARALLRAIFPKRNPYVWTLDRF